MRNTQGFRSAKVGNAQDESTSRSNKRTLMVYRMMCREKQNPRFRGGTLPRRISEYYELDKAICRQAYYEPVLVLCSVATADGKFLLAAKGESG